MTEISNDKKIKLADGRSRTSPLPTETGRVHNLTEAITYGLSQLQTKAVQAQKTSGISAEEIKEAAVCQVAAKSLAGKGELK